jgi:hypothetical protein
LDVDRVAKPLERGFMEGFAPRRVGVNRTGYIFKLRPLKLSE